MRQWAFAWYEKPPSNVAKQFPLGRGAEPEVFFDAKCNRVIKVTRKSDAANYGFGISLNNDGQGATAAEYLDRWMLHNTIFGDDVRLEGVQPAVGQTRIILSQPFIQGEKSLPEQIDEYMARKGFERLTAGTYYHEASGVLVHDLHPRNAVATPAGNVRAIDPAILRGTPELARFIRRQAGL